MKNRIAFGIFFFLTLITSTVFGYFSENPRQGSTPTFSSNQPGSQPILSFTTAVFLESEAKQPAGSTFVSVYDGEDESHEYLVTPKSLTKEWKFGPFCWKPQLPKLQLYREFIGGPGTDDIQATKYHGRYLNHLKDALGSTIALTNRGGNAVARVNYDAFGSFRWPDKPGHGVAPCKEFDLDDILDRFDGGRSFGFDPDPFHFGRHFGRVFTPYLYASRRLDSFSNLYNHRNRMMNPRFGRFLSKDPIGFLAGQNRYGYCRNNPVVYIDPSGFLRIVGGEIWDHNEFINAFKPKNENWDIPNFWLHYLARLGGTIDLADIGLLKAYQNSNSVQQLIRTYKSEINNHIDKHGKALCEGWCEGKITGSFSLSGANPDTPTSEVLWEPGLYCVGKSSFIRSASCQITADCGQRTISFTCLTSYRITDSFSEPFSPIGIKREILWGLPYDITANWSEIYSGNDSF